MSLILTAIPGIPLIHSGDDLAAILLQALAGCIRSIAGWGCAGAGSEDRFQGRRQMGEPG